MCRLPRAAYGRSVTSRQTAEVVSPDATAKVWDEYLKRFGPAAYVAARYIHASDLLAPKLEDESDRTSSPR